MTPPLRLLVVMDELHTIKPGMDTTAAIIGDACSRDHLVDVCTGEQLALVDGTPSAPVRSVVGMASNEVPQVGEPRPGARLADYDVVLIRKNPPFDSDYFVQTLMLERARGDCVLVNDPRGLREANEKLAILDFPSLIPPTLVTRSIPALQRFLTDCGGDIIVKPLDSYSGHGVLRVRSSDPNRDALLELATAVGRTPTMAQAYIAGAAKGDKRIMMLGGEPIGCFIRVPAAGGLRGNLRAGATLATCPLTPRDEDICAAVGPRLREQGLHFVGLDVVGGLLTELNVTSPGGIREFTHACGERVEGLVVDWLEEAVAERRRGRRRPVAGPAERFHRS